jgi:hypothetical protein
LPYSAVNVNFNIDYDPNGKLHTVRKNEITEFPKYQMNVAKIQQFAVADRIWFAIIGFEWN